MHALLGAIIGLAIPILVDSLSIFYKHHFPCGQCMSIYDTERTVPVLWVYCSPLPGMNYKVVHSPLGYPSIGKVVDLVFHKYGNRSGLDVALNVLVLVPDIFCFFFHRQH